MKTPRLTPKRTSAGWLLNIPAALSSNGKRQRQFFPSKDAAEKVAAPLREKMRQGTAGGVVLPPVEGEAARKAVAMLAASGLSALDLVKAAENLVRERDLAARSVTFEAACESYVAERSKASRTAAHLADFGRLCRRFPDFAARLLCEITRKEIKRTLAPLPASAHNLALREVRAVFNYGTKEGWCKDNPAANLDFADAGKPKVPTLTAKQLRRLFVAAIRLHPGLVPLLAVQTFAGVRPVESSKLHWDDLDLEGDDDKTITIRADIAKTGNARHINMHPQLVAWIEWHQARGGEADGPLVPARYNTPRKLKAPRKPKLGRDSRIPEPLRDALQEIRERAGIIPWPQDALRHTYASAALASKWREIPGVCADLGHGDLKMLRKHYEKAMRRRPAERIFAVRPPERINGGKILAFRAA